MQRFKKYESISKKFDETDANYLKGICHVDSEEKKLKNALKLH